MCQQSWARAIRRHKRLEIACFNGNLARACEDGNVDRLGGIGEMTCDRPTKRAKYPGFEMCRDFFGGAEEFFGFLNVTRAGEREGCSR